MEILAGMAVLIATVAALVHAERKAERERAEREELGLVPDTGSPAAVGSYTLEREGLRFEVLLGEQFLRVRVSGPERIDPAIGISREPILKGPGSTELQMGDPAFDNRAYLLGPDDRVAAALSPPARELIEQFFRKYADVNVSGGTLELNAQGRRELRPFLERAAALYRALRPDGRAVPGRLLDNARQDPDRAVSDTHLRLLLRHHPDTEEGQQAVPLAEGRDDPELRLLAAGARAEGRVEALAALVRDGDLGFPHRLSALRALRPDASAHPEVFETLLRRTDGEIQGAVAEFIALGRLYGLQPCVLELGARAEGLARVGFCRAWARFREPAAQPHLLGMLGGYTEVAIEAAHALAELGTVEAVPKLMQHTSGIFTEPALKSAARQAITKIQARLDGAEVGDLSLVEDSEVGELSMAEEVGELSLPGSGRK